MDVARKTFFYRRGEKWITTTLLPPSVHVDWKKYVLLELDTDKPYLHHADIAKKYPPTQGKIRESVPNRELLKDRLRPIAPLIERKAPARAP